MVLRGGSSGVEAAGMGKTVLLAEAEREARSARTRVLSVAGDRAVLVFGAGNRDPDAYNNPDEIVIGRENNRHLAFGGGIHRCLGSNLGRRELVVALEEFLAVVGNFSLANPSEQWHGVGPLTLHIGR